MQLEKRKPLSLLSLRIKFLKESFLVSRTDSQSFLTTNALILRKFEIELLNRFAFRTVSIEDRVGTKYTPRRFVGQGVIDDFHLHEAWLNVARSDCDGATMRLRERQWNLAAPLYILLHCLRVKTNRRRRVEIGQGKKCRGVPTRVRDTPSPLRPEPWEKTRFHKKKTKNHFFFIKVHAFAIKFRVTRQKFRLIIRWVIRIRILWYEMRRMQFFDKSKEKKRTIVEEFSFIANKVFISFLTIYGLNGEPKFK